tara:strand:+ start:483 stop:602 length:120 start_codon:yes stop_codon:yes gene_type:complete
MSAAIVHKIFIGPQKDGPCEEREACAVAPGAAIQLEERD